MEQHLWLGELFQMNFCAMSDASERVEVMVSEYFFFERVEGEEIPEMGSYGLWKVEADQGYGITESE